MNTARINRASLSIAALILVTLSLTSPAVAAPPRRDAQRLQNDITRDARERLRRVEHQRQDEKAQREAKDREQRELQDRARREAQDRARQQAADEYAKSLAKPAGSKSIAPGSIKTPSR